jgi:hypothetical protein
MRQMLSFSPSSATPLDSKEEVWRLQQALMMEAEQMLGARNASKTICQPRFRVGNPQIVNTIDKTGALAELSMGSLRNWGTCVFELAHETVHLLDPLPCNARELEEGVAVAFSQHCVQALASICGPVPYPVTPMRYTRAWQRAEALSGGALSAGKIVRAAAGTLDNITPALVCSLFPFTGEIATALCRRW